MNIQELDILITKALIKINREESTAQEKLDGFVALITLQNSKISALQGENCAMLKALVARKAYPWYKAG